jgi:hypothetical protein
MRIPLLLLPPCWRCWIASLWRTCAASAPPWAGAATLPAPKIWWKIGGKQKDGGSDSDDPDDRQATKLAHRAAAAGNLDGHGSDTDDNHDDDDGDAASGEEDTEGENAASPHSSRRTKLRRHRGSTTTVSIETFCSADCHDAMLDWLKRSKLVSDNDSTLIEAVLALFPVLRDAITTAKADQQGSKGKSNSNNVGGGELREKPAAAAAAEAARAPGWGGGDDVQQNIFTVLRARRVYRRRRRSSLLHHHRTLVLLRQVILHLWAGFGIPTADCANSLSCSFYAGIAVRQRVTRNRTLLC